MSDFQTILEERQADRLIEQLRDVVAQQHGADTSALIQVSLAEVKALLNRIDRI